MEAPPGLDDRGRRMWQQSVAVWQLTPAHLVLLEEACRLADRLDTLDELIRSDPEDIAALLAEARQHSVALKGLIAELRQGQKTAAGMPTRAGSEGKGVSDLTRRIAERRRQAES